MYQNYGIRLMNMSFFHMIYMLEAFFALFSKLIAYSLRFTTVLKQHSTPRIVYRHFTFMVTIATLNYLQ